MRNFPDIAYGPDEMQKLDLWLPDDGEFDLYIHLHGEMICDFISTVK